MLYCCGMRVCSVAGCGKRHYAKGLCRPCYGRTPQKLAQVREAQRVRRQDPAVIAHERAYDEARRAPTRRVKPEPKTLEQRRAEKREYQRLRRQAQEVRARERTYDAVRRQCPDVQQREKKYRAGRYSRDPVQGLADAHTRRARKAATGGRFSKAEWAAILAAYNHTCPGCGKTDVKLTVDHVLPVSRGGTSNADNLQPLCLSCNSRKGHRSTERLPPWPEGNRK